MNILFIGNFQTGPGGEAADEVHLTRELEAARHAVTRINRDEWREYVREEQPKGKYHIPEFGTFDYVIICKWHHFYDETFINTARIKYKCPVFYWVWDWMNGEEWHMKMAKAADLYLSGELGSALEYKSAGVPFYYFQFDVCDGGFLQQFVEEDKKKYDVVFLGSCTNQNGRLDVLKKINEQTPIQVFGYDYEEWRKQGFKAEPAVYGDAFNRVVAQSRIVLGTSANHNCFGYWSNRIGKVLFAGGFLLQWYTPGMENFLEGSCDFFSNSDEAVMKIKMYLNHPKLKQDYLDNNMAFNRFRWTSKYKIAQLQTLLERYKEDYRGEAWLLP